MRDFGISQDLRRPSASGHQKVTMVELFFDLVFVFAITQLSHALLADVSIENGLRIGMLLLAVWWAWIYTSWATNWLDPDQTAVRHMLFVLMLSGLVMSAAIPRAFTDRGLAFARAFVVIQVGRTAFACWALRRHSDSHYRNFARITCWLALSGVFWIAGGLVEGTLRLSCWAIALVIEYAAPAFGFWTPHLGRSTTRDWDIDPAHMAERCALFVIIALGESLLVTGATFAAAVWTPATAMAFVVAVVGSIAMWWVYFNIGAEEATDRFKTAEDPGGIARLAYTYLHLPIVAGIVVAAVADELVLAHPAGATDAKTATTLVGSSLLFIGGTLLFKRVTLRRWPLSHLVGLGLLTLLVPTAPVLWPLGAAALNAGILVLVAIWETLSLKPVKSRVAPTTAHH